MADPKAAIERELLRHESVVVAASASSYQLTLVTGVTTDNGGVVAHYQLRGHLGLVPLGAQGGGHVVQATLTDGSLSDVNFSDPDQRVPQDFVAGFAKPCFITFGPAGAVTELRIAPGLPSFVQTTWKVIAGVVQTSAPARLGQSSWKAREFDAAGEYSVQYEVLAAHLIKHKLSYLGPAGPLSASQQVTASDGDFAFRDGAVETLSVHERERATPASPWPAMTSEISFKLVRAPSVPAASNGWRADFEAGTPTKLQDRPTLDSRRADSDRARARNANVDALLKGAQSSDEKEKLTAYQTLVSLLRVDETVVPRVTQAAREGGALGNWMGAALGDAGCEACQGGLADLISDPKLDAAGHLSALQALGRVESPNPRTRVAIEGLLDDTALGFQAKLSLGSVIFRLKDRDAKVATEALQVLEARVRKGDALESLKAIGNAGTAESLPLLTEQLADSSASVRAAAVGALRRIVDPRVETLLVQALTRDESPQVKAAALEASRQHGMSPALLAAIVPLVENDADTATQTAAVSLIGDFGPAAKSTAVEHALQHVIDHTSVDSLHEAAQRVLERVRGNG
jgi:hypothetical protein